MQQVSEPSLQVEVDFKSSIFCGPYSDEWMMAGFVPFLVKGKRLNHEEHEGAQRNLKRLP